MKKYDKDFAKALICLSGIIDIKKNLEDDIKFFDNNKYPLEEYKKDFEDNMKLLDSIVEYLKPITDKLKREYQQD